MSRNENTSTSNEGAPGAIVTPSTLWMAAGVTLGVAALVAFAATRVYRRASSDLRVERGWAASPADTQRVRESQADRLNSYTVVDRATGVVTIPIRRAMGLVAAEAGRTNGEAPR